MPTKARIWLFAIRRWLPGGQALIVAAVGVFLVSFSALGPFEDFSYDLATWLKPTMTVTNAVLVYIDPVTLKTLGSDAGGNELNRTNYASLLDILAKDNARLVFLDVIFNQSDTRPDVDQNLAQAIRRQGQVVLAADSVREPVSGGEIETLLQPIDVLSDAAKVRYGHVKVLGNVAAIISAPWFSGYNAFTNSAVWVAATNLEPKLQNEDGNRERWLNYYCEPFIEAFTNCSLQDAVSPNFPSGFFAGKIVFVGQNLQTGDIDTCGTPYSRFGSARSPGVVINAMELLNLFQGDWLRRVPETWQWLVAVIWAYVSVGLLYSLSRKSKLILVLAAGMAAMALCAVSLYAQWHLHRWWSWIGPAFGQTPLALLLVMRNPKPDRYIAFISYRTEDDGAAALLIQRSLRDHGVRTFVDVQSLHAGKFDEQLLNEIESATFFILILSPNSLARCTNDGDWVLREITHALAKQKKIIPVLKGGFRFDAKQGIPDLPQINELKNYQGVGYSNADFDGFMAKLKALLVAS
jgi:CHASE2 domain-containing sensor protein